MAATDPPRNAELRVFTPRHHHAAGVICGGECHGMTGEPCPSWCHLASPAKTTDREPLIRRLAAPYKGMRMTALDVQCPYCNAAPTEPCRSQSVGENATTATHTVTAGLIYRHTKRPHPERADAARRGQVRAD